MKRSDPSPVGPDHAEPRRTVPRRGELCVALALAVLAVAAASATPPETATPPATTTSPTASDRSAQTPAEPVPFTVEAEYEPTSTPLDPPPAAAPSPAVAATPGVTASSPGWYAQLDRRTGELVAGGDDPELARREAARRRSASRVALRERVLPNGAVEIVLPTDMSSALHGWLDEHGLLHIGHPSQLPEAAQVDAESAPTAPTSQREPR